MTSVTKECVASILRDTEAAGASSNAVVTQKNTFFRCTSPSLCLSFSLTHLQGQSSLVCLPLNNVLMTKWLYFRTYANCPKITVSFSVKLHSLVEAHKSSGGNCCLTFCSVNGNSRVFQDRCTHLTIYLASHTNSL